MLLTVTDKNKFQPTPGGFGLYVHWPFCLSKCPYCDFNSHVRETIDHDQWRSALICELDHIANLAPNRLLNSIFFGGGTPSLMPPETVAAIIDHAAKIWHFASDIEITLEANPTSIEADKFHNFRTAGINRVSVGVQALDDAALKFLGRGHSSAEARGAIQIAARIFPRWSFDLIYGRPGQTVEAWDRELDEALGMADSHLSLYTLTIEENTGFAGAVRRGAFVMPNDEILSGLYAFTQDKMSRAGLPAYEISNHAKPGEESRHNLVYWRYGEYAGIGPGAHGRLTIDGQKTARQAIRKPEAWLQSIFTRGHGEESISDLSDNDCAREALLMGLRLAEGIDARRFEAVTGRSLWQSINLDECSRMEQSGFLVRQGDALISTAKGLAVLDGLLARIVL